MGLDISHDCWRGAYSAFMRWRKEICKVAGMPPLELMAGFYVPLKDPNLPTLYRGMGTRTEQYMIDLDSLLPISWDCLTPSPLHKLLHHSDCDGELAWEDCAAIADALEKLLPKFPNGDGGGHIGNWRDKTQQFVDGLRRASAAKENVDFH